MPNEISTAPRTDVLDNGKELESNNALSDIFSKIEEGKSEGKETKDIIEELAASNPEVAVEEKKEPAADVKVEAKEEKVERVKEGEPTDLEQRLKDDQHKKDDKAEDISRESLREQADPKKDEKVEVKEDKKDEKKPEDAIPDEELQPLPHDKPRTVKRIQALLSKIEEVKQSEANTKKEVATRDAELKKLQDQLKDVKTVDPKTDEEIKGQLDELSKFRRLYELEKDPEIKTKFDSRIESSESSILTTLKAKGAGDALLGLIKEEGGWNKFAGSSRQITLTDGSKVTAAQLADQVINNLPLADRKAVDAAMVEQIQTGRDRDRYFQEQKEGAVKYFKERDEQQQVQFKSQQEQVKQVEEQIQNWFKETQEKTEWLKTKPIPENATPEQKKVIEEDNKYSKQLESLLRKSLQTKDVKDALQITFDSVQMFQERREKANLLTENQRLKAELASKQGEIDKFRLSSRSTPRGGNLSSKAESVAPSKKEYASLEETLTAMASGELSRSQILRSDDE